MNRFPLLAFTMLSFATPALAGECQLEFVESAQSVNLPNIEIGVGEFSRESFNVSVRNTGGVPCDGVIRFTRVGVSVADTPQYSLQSGPTVLEILPQHGSSTLNSDLLITASPTDSSGRPIPFQISVPSEWGLKAGNYGDQIELALLDTSGMVLDTLLLTVYIDVPRAVALRVVGATGFNEVARIDLGNLSAERPTTSDPFGVRIWSTSGYRVEFSSENRSELVHEGNLDRIAYQLHFNNQLVNLVGGDGFLFGQHTSSLGQVHSLRVEVGQVVARAGQYTDKVTVTVTAV